MGLSPFRFSVASGGRNGGDKDGQDDVGEQDDDDGDGDGEDRPEVSHLLLNLLNHWSPGTHD